MLMVVTKECTCLRPVVRYKAEIEENTLYPGEIITIEYKNDQIKVYQNEYIGILQDEDAIEEYNKMYIFNVQKKVYKKICTLCERELDSTEFYENAFRCKTCTKLIQKTLYPWKSIGPKTPHWRDKFYTKKFANKS